MLQQLESEVQSIIKSQIKISSVLSCIISNIYWHCKHITFGDVDTLAPLGVIIPPPNQEHHYKFVHK